MTKRDKTRALALPLFAALLLCTLCACSHSEGETALPAHLRALNVEVESVTTRSVEYRADNRDAAAVREVRVYTDRAGNEYCYDGAGEPVSYRAAEADGQQSGLPQSGITEGWVAERIGGLVEDVEEFSIHSVTQNEVSGYEVILKKNEGTVCEDELILRLTGAGEVHSLSVNRSGIADASEVDTAYFEGELQALLETATDTVVEQHISYMKVDGTVCALCVVVFRDAAGGQYTAMYTIM